MAINSTAFENNENGQSEFVGSKTETSLLQFARDNLGMGPLAVERSNANVVQMFPFDSGRKCMGVVLKNADGSYRLYVKGASEILLKHCTRILRDPRRGMETMPIPQDNVDALGHLIETYASRTLRTIGFLVRDFESWPPRGVRTTEEDRNMARFEDVLKNMTFFGLVGIQDPLRPGVAQAVIDCIRAGVFPRMVTGDNILTAKAIASECGIFTAGGIATPADAALMMQFGMDGIFVGSGIFKSKTPEKMAKAIVEATAHYDEAKIVSKVSNKLGDAMAGLEESSLETKMAGRGH